MQDNGRKRKKRSLRLFSHEDDDSAARGESVASEGRSDYQEDVSSSHQDGDLGSSKAESNPHDGVKVETYPDSENEFHEVVRNQNWDLLEILLKEYDFKKYIKPKAPKKQTRKLRVAKYLPEVHWKKEVELPHSPLHGIDALGRAPLHLCCLSPCPAKPLLRLLFCAREIASVPDATGSLPIHLAVNHDHSIEVIDKLIRAYYQGAVEQDASGRTPLLWAIEMISRQNREGKEVLPAHHTFWAYPRSKEAALWQLKQTSLWQMVNFMLVNRKTRRQKLLPVECRKITTLLGLAATPDVVSLFLDLSKSVLRNEKIAGPALAKCISRQYPVDLVEKVIDGCPMDFAKEFTDGTGRGVVAAHYRIGCIAHQEDASDRNSMRESFRMIMQKLANAAGNLQPNFTPGKAYQLWWEKLKFFINLWGTHTLEDEEDSHEDFHMDDLLLHNALSNSDVPPSLIRLLAALRPHATDLEHPKSTALPIHLACRVWRYKIYPPRRGEKETHLDKVVLQLLEGDFSRTRKRYKDRLPLHHAIAAGHQWMFMKPLVVMDRKSLTIRDPATKLYPFQLAASCDVKIDFLALARRKFTIAQWNGMPDPHKEDEAEKVAHYYELGQLSLVYEILRHDPAAVSHDSITQARANRTKSRRVVATTGLVASEEVMLTAQIKAIRTMFGVGTISGHFLMWAYESTRRGWKTHRSHFGVLKEAIMDGFIASVAMDEWWRKLKVLIWSDCPWGSTVPRRDDYLLHGALCNPDTSPWIINLIVECFPRSASIPLPDSEGCYPLHIACVTDKYVPLSFEFPNKNSVIGMLVKAYPDGTLLKWRGRLPLHLALAHSKEWDDIKCLVDEEPVALAVADPVESLLPFHLMALDRPFTAEQRTGFEKLAEQEVGAKEWKSLSAYERASQMKEVLERHESNTLGGVWELLRRNASLVSTNLHDIGIFSQSRKRTSIGLDDSSSGQLETSRTFGLDCELFKASDEKLSRASITFLHSFFEENSKKEAARKDRAIHPSSKPSDVKNTKPFLDGSIRMGSNSKLTVENSTGSPTATAAKPALHRGANVQGKRLRSTMKTEGSIIDPIAGKPFHLSPAAPESSSSRPLGGRSMEAPTAIIMTRVGSSTSSTITMEESITGPYAGNTSSSPTASARAIETTRVGTSSRSTITMEESITGPFAGKMSCPPPKSAGAVVAALADVGDGDASFPAAELSRDGEPLGTGYMYLEMPQLSQHIQQELCRPRRKDILVIRNGSAHIVWGSTVSTPGTIEKSLRKGCWAEVLQLMGEEVSMADMYIVRHEQEQCVVSSAFVEGDIVLIDEDESYRWVICGKEACSAIENYDVDAAIYATSTFLDGNMGVWFEDIVRPRCTELSDEKDPDRILAWVLSSTAKSVRVPNLPRFMIPHSALRKSFAKGSSGAIDVDASVRTLSFEIARHKIERMISQRRFIGVRYFVARGACFQRQRLKFIAQERAVKFIKSLKRKQRKGSRARYLTSDHAEPTAVDKSATGHSRPPAKLQVGLTTVSNGDDSQSLGVIGRQPPPGSGLSAIASGNPPRQREKDPSPDPPRWSGEREAQNPRIRSSNEQGVDIVGSSSPRSNSMLKASRKVIAPTKSYEDSLTLEEVFVPAQTKRSPQKGAPGPITAELVRMGSVERANGSKFSRGDQVIEASSSTGPRKRLSVVKETTAVSPRIEQSSPTQKKVQQWRSSGLRLQRNENAA